MNGNNGSEEIWGSEETLSRAASNVASDESLSPIRIWMVDDSENYRVLLASLLSAEPGLEITRQFWSPEGLLEALARETAPDVILLDIQMGPCNGLDSIRAIKTLARHTHVLMLTTFAEPEARERAFREGASDFMVKSWTPSRIATRIRAAMELGSVAGLVTAFLGRAGASGQSIPSARGSESVDVSGKSNHRGRGWQYLRGLLRFDPSQG